MSRQQGSLDQGEHPTFDRPIEDGMRHRPTSVHIMSLEDKASAFVAQVPRSGPGSGEVFQSNLPSPQESYGQSVSQRSEFFEKIESERRSTWPHFV
jgi:hypothetical protein